MNPEAPRVVGERVRPRRERRYPVVVASHPWSTKPVEGRLDFILSKTAEQKVRNHCLENPAIEVMGLLVGDVYEDEGGAYALALDAITAPVVSDSVHVAFDKSAIDTLAEAFDLVCGDHLVIGWYHSHPGHGCFLSDTDVATQQGCFKEPLSSALVLDPVNLEISLFRIIGEEVAVLPVGVCTERYEDPFTIPDIVESHGRYVK